MRWAPLLFYLSFFLASRAAWVTAIPICTEFTVASDDPQYTTHKKRSLPPEALKFILILSIVGPVIIILVSFLAAFLVRRHILRNEGVSRHAQGGKNSRLRRGSRRGGKRFSPVDISSMKEKGIVGVPVTRNSVGSGMGWGRQVESPSHHLFSGGSIISTSDDHSLANAPTRPPAAYDPSLHSHPPSPSSFSHPHSNPRSRSRSRASTLRIGSPEGFRSIESQVVEDWHASKPPHAPAPAHPPSSWPTISASSPTRTSSLGRREWLSGDNQYMGYQSSQPPLPRPQGRSRATSSPQLY